MPAALKRLSAPRLIGLLTVGVLALILVLAGGSGSQGAPITGLAAHAPPETMVYAETDLEPDGRVSAEVDRSLERLTGMDLDTALGRAMGRGAGIDYLEEIQPWAAGPVAVSLGVSRSDFGLIAETDDPKDAESFADDLRSRRILPEAAKVGMVGDSLVLAASREWFDRISSAAEGESLADTAAFADSIGKLPDGGMATFFISNAVLVRAIQEEGFAASSVLGMLGVETGNPGTAMALLAGADRIRLEGSTGLDAGVAGGGAGELMASFPVNSLLAAGIDDAGRSLTELTEAVDQTGTVPVPGSGDGDAPSGIESLLGQASAFGVDLPALIESLDQVALFVTGRAGAEMRGAVVATTSDPELVRESVRSISDLGAFTGGDLFQKLGGALEGFSIALPGMPSRVVVATRGERLAIGLGNAAVRRGLMPGSRTLGDTALFRESIDHLTDTAPLLFARPAPFASLLRGGVAKHGGAADRPKVRQAIRSLRGIESVVAGTGDGGSLEIDLSLRP